MSGPRTDAAIQEDTPADVSRALHGNGAVLARFDRPRSVAGRTVAVVSDPHVSVTGTGTWKLFHRTRQRFLQALDEVEAQDVDCLVLAGDLTKDGAPADYNWMDGVLGSSSVPALAVPGNHDVTGGTAEEFAARFTDDGYPTTCRVGDVDLIGLNSVVAPDADDGDGRRRIVSKTQLTWLETHLPEADDPVVITHHNLPGVEAVLADHEWDPHPPIENAGELVSVLDRHGVGLHVSGHVHVLAGAQRQGVNALVAPALSSFPQAYLRLDIDATGTTVRCRTPADQDGIAEAYEAARDGPARGRTVAEVNGTLLADPPAPDGTESTLGPSEMSPADGRRATDG